MAQLVRHYHHLTGVLLEEPWGTLGRSLKARAFQCNAQEGAPAFLLLCAQLLAQSRKTNKAS